VFSFALVGVAAAQEGHQGDTVLEAELDGLVGRFVDSHPVPGLAVGVVKNSQVAYAKGFGVADLRTGDRVTSQTLFHTASASKTFVATAVMQLVESEKLNLDAPAADYLPYFQLDDDRAGQLTVRQLLTHTSGMPDVRDYQWDRPEDDAGALERYVRSLKTRTLIAPPGQGFHYSNMAYEVLGDVIAKVSGQPFELYMQEHVLNPLAMRRSTFLKADVDTALCAQPHVGRRKPKVSDVYPYNRAHAPSSTLHSNIEEMCNWVIANVNRGEFKEQRILKETGYDEIWKPHTDAGRDTEIGLAWMLRRRPYGLVVFHGGRDIGFQSQVILLPDARSGLVILCNTSDLRLSPLRNEIMKAAFGEAGK
jgi:CubicO group peptidase (beta-lactamase class C family)